MLKSGAAVVAGMMLVIGLTGCGASVRADGVGQSSSTPSATSAPVESDAPAAPAAAPIPAGSSAPVAETPATTSEYGEYTQDEFYLLSAAPGWHGATPTDEQLIGAAHLVCEQLSAGASRLDIRVVEGEGEDADANNLSVVTYGIQVYCPELG